MNLKDRVYDLIPLLIIGFLFRKYAAPHLVSDERELVKKFLYNDNYSNTKPYLWIHIPQDENCRNWNTFNERKTTDINTPYIEYTIKTIVEKNKDFFNICVLTDDNLIDIIPNWSYDISMFSGEKKNRIRELAKQQILYYYGGLLVPPSLLCLKSLRSLYVYSDIKPFKIYCSKSESIYGSKKHDPYLQSYITEIKSYINNLSIEIEFNDSINRTGDNYFMDVDNKLFGVIDKNDKYISINLLLGENKIPFADNIFGIYIPRIEIQNSIKYGWFQYETILNISNSSIYISKYFKNL